MHSYGIPRGTLPWLREEAQFACGHALTHADDDTFPASDLAVMQDGSLICLDCYTELHDGDAEGWVDLPSFRPFARLERVLREGGSTAEMIASNQVDPRKGAAHILMLIEWAQRLDIDEDAQLWPSEEPLDSKVAHLARSLTALHLAMSQAEQAATAAGICLYPLASIGRQVDGLVNAATTPLVMASASSTDAVTLAQRIRHAIETSWDASGGASKSALARIASIMCGPSRAVEKVDACREVLVEHGYGDMK